MPCEIAFSKKLQSLDHGDYINECCIGGDVVASCLLPALAARYGEQEPGEEDWGWFIWFDHAGVRLAIDIFCDDPETGAYRIHLTSSTRGWLRQAVRDTPELEVLRETVVAALSEWLGYVPDVQPLDKNHDPIG